MRSSPKRRTQTKVHQAAIMQEVLQLIEAPAASGKMLIMYQRPVWCPDEIPIYVIIRNKLNAKFSVAWSNRSHQDRLGRKK